MTDKKITVSVSSGGEGSGRLNNGGGFRLPTDEMRVEWSLDQDPSNFNPSESESTPMTDDLVKRLRVSCYLAFEDGTNDYGSAIEAADRIEALEAGFQVADEKWSKISARCEALEAALNKCVDIVETYRIPVGNSAAGEMACEWTYDALKRIRDDMKDVIRAALAGEKKDD